MNKNKITDRCVCVRACVRACVLDDASMHGHTHSCHTFSKPHQNKKGEKKHTDTCLFVKCGTAGLERMKAVGEKRRSDRFLRGEKLDEGPETLPIRRE